MINRKLLEILENLSSEEKDRLLLFVQSPYHNSAPQAVQLIVLLQYILECLAQEKPSALEKEKVSQKFFPNHTYIENKKNPVDTLTSSLFQITREFLYIEGNSRDKKAGQLLTLAKFYRENSSENRFLQTINLLRKHLEKKQERGAWYYMDYFLMEEEVSSFETTFNTYTSDSNLIKAHQYLDQFYAIIKLEFSAVLMFQKQLGQIDTKKSFLLTEAIIESFNEYSDLQTPLASLYLDVLKLLESNQYETTHFLEKAHSLEKEVPVKKFRNLMAFARYFLARAFHQTNDPSEIWKNMFNLFKDHLDHKYFETNGKIMPQTLKTFVAIAIQVHELTSAKGILKTYGPNRITGTRFPKEAHDLCLAEVYFAEKDYEAAYEKLNYKKFENVNYSILADVLLVKIYYMTEDFLLESRVHALEQKVRRSKLNKNNQRQYLNFINVIKRIIKYNFDRHTKQWQKIQKDVTELTPLLEREWLKSIVSEEKE